jgi:kynurenine formamidase
VCLTQSAPPCDLEKLYNLEGLQAHGFTISRFPHKIRGASAG